MSSCGEIFEFDYNGFSYRRIKMITPSWFLLKDWIDNNGNSETVTVSYQIHDESLIKELENVFRQKKLERICKTK